MKSARQQVQAVFPNAILVQDSNTDYPSEWASTCSFAIGYFTGSDQNKSAQVQLVTYHELVVKHNWNFLSGWAQTKQAAWKAAWRSIEYDMIKKLEKQ